MISLELDKHIARVRRLANGGAIIHFLDTGETFIGLNVDGKIDLCRASRLSRGAAHRLVDALTDADPAQKTHYHMLIDEEANSNVQ